MSAHARYPWWVGPAAFLGALVLRALGSTWRIERHGMDPSDPGRASPEPCIFVSWHSRLLPLAYTHRGRGIAILISRHLDGEIVARVVHHLGFRSARGSSTRQAGSGTLGMIGLAREGCLGLTPDGPRGPAEVMKPGPAYLAGRTGLPIVAITSASSSCWTLRSWDRMRIPRPFARVRIEVGPPITVPPGLSDSDLESWRLRLERELGEVTVRNARAVGESA
jgi:lysophospholipid acyltransferase (LPLAT)-like uncharacterized protein